MNAEATWAMTGGRVAASNQEAAFERVFRAEYARVHGIATRIVGDPARAEDVVQDAFLALHRRRCSDQAWAGSWVCAAAAHGALNLLRSERRRQRRERLAPAPSEPADPAAAVVHRDEGRALRAALARLPARVATVLVLRHSGLSYAEVADAMGVKEGAVGTMLRRAEAALRQEVDRAPSL